MMQAPSSLYIPCSIMLRVLWEKLSIYDASSIKSLYSMQYNADHAYSYLQVHFNVCVVPFCCITDPVFCFIFHFCSLQVSDLLVLQCVLANLTPTAKCLSSAGECQRWLASVRKVSSPIDSLIAALERDGSGRLGAQAQNLMDTCRYIVAPFAGEVH